VLTVYMYRRNRISFFRRTDVSLSIPLVPSCFKMLCILLPLPLLLPLMLLLLCFILLITHLLFHPSTLYIVNSGGSTRLRFGRLSVVYL
jgi:hypothetical protein